MVGDVKILLLVVTDIRISAILKDDVRISLLCPYLKNCVTESHKADAKCWTSRCGDLNCITLTCVDYQNICHFVISTIAPDKAYLFSR